MNSSYIYKQREWLTNFNGVNSVLVEVMRKHFLSLKQNLDHPKFDVDDLGVKVSNDFSKNDNHKINFILILYLLKVKCANIILNFALISVSNTKIS